MTVIEAPRSLLRDRIHLLASDAVVYLFIYLFHFERILWAIAIWTSLIDLLNLYEHMKCVDLD